MKKDDALHFVLTHDVLSLLQGGAKPEEIGSADIKADVFQAGTKVGQAAVSVSTDGGQHSINLKLEF